MADWILPDGFTDADSVWTDEAKAYDFATGTYAWSLENSNMWQHTLEVHFSTDCINVTKIRAWVSMGPDAVQGDLQIRVYDGIGGEELVKNSPIAEGQYVEIAVNVVHTVRYISIRFMGTGLVNGQQRVHELHAFGDGGPGSLPAFPEGTLTQSYYY